MFKLSLGGRGDGGGLGTRIFGGRISEILVDMS